MSSCDCSRPIVIVQGASGGVSTLYTADATILADRTVNANNNDVTFNMGTGIFTVNGLLKSSGLDMLTVNSNPGDSNTLWASGNSLYIGNQNLSIRVSNNAGNLVTYGSDSGIYLDGSIICGSLMNCSLSQLGDVTSTVASSGNLLFFNGTDWTPRSVSIDSLSDVNLTVSAPTNGSSLVYSTIYSSFIAQPVLTSLSISGAGTQISIVPGEVLGVNASGDLSLSVSGNQFRFSFTETNTELLFDSGLNLLTYKDENGSSNVIDLNILDFRCTDLQTCSINSLQDVATSGAITGDVLTYNGSSWVPEDPAPFSCASLNACSIESMNDVVYPAAPVNGDTLVYSSIYSAFIPGAAFTNFRVSDGVNQQQINQGQTVLFSGSGNMNVLVSPVDTVILGYSEVVTELTYDSGTNTLTYIDENGTATNLSLYTGGAFSCASLTACSINSLGDVNTTGVVAGQILSWNGTNWVPIDPSGGGFLCSQLATCPIDALADVSGVPTANQALVWDSGLALYRPSGIMGAFRITDGITTQTLSNNETITFTAGGQLSVSVLATDTVRYSFNETLTTMVFNSGTRILAYQNESGTVTNVSIPSGFTCSMLNSCSIDALSDVNTAGVVTNNVLKYNGSAWVPGTAVGGVSSDVGNNLTLGTDSLPYLNEALTSLTVSGGSSLAYQNESGIYNTINICTMIGNCSVDALSDVTISAPSLNQVLRWNGSAWVNSNENVAGSYSFSITDGTTTQVINTTNTITFADSSCINAVVSATDTVTMNAVVSPPQDIDGTSGIDVFPNALSCTSSGLFVPCLLVEEPTISANGTEKLILKVPCGSTYTSYNIPWFDNIKRVPLDTATVVDGDAAEVGVDLVIDSQTGELFYQSDLNEYKKARGTYGYSSNTAFVSGTPKNISHGLDTEYVIVQMYLSNIQKNDCTIEILSSDVVRIITPSTGTYKVCILPVYPLVV